MKGPNMTDDPPSEQNQLDLESLKDLQSVIEGRISRLEGLRKLNVSSSLLTQQEIKALENKVNQMFGRQLAIRHRQTENNEELEQFPKFEMWLYVMDIHGEAKELLSSRLKTLMALVEMPENEVRSLMKLCRCSEDATSKLLLGLKNVKKVYRAHIQDQGPASAVDSTEEVDNNADDDELESPPNSPSESSSHSLKHPSSSSLTSEPDQAFHDHIPVPQTPPYMIYEDHPSKRYTITPPSTPTIKKNKPRGTPPPNKKLMSLPPTSQLKRSISSEVSPHKVDMSLLNDLSAKTKFFTLKSPSHHSSSSLDTLQPRRHSEDGTLDQRRRTSHSSPFRNDPNKHDSLNIIDATRKARTLNIRRSPRQPSKMAHKIKHRFTKRTFLKPITCAFCHEKFIVKGYKCKDCKYVCHSKCMKQAVEVPSCGLPQKYEQVFKERYENPEKTAAQISLEDDDFPNDAPSSPFSPGDSSSNPSSTTSSTPSSPAPYATSSASLTPSSPITASPNPSCRSDSQFTFDVVDSFRGDHIHSVNSDVTLTVDSSSSQHPFTDSEHTLPDPGIEVDYASDNGSTDQTPLTRKLSSNPGSEWDVPYDQLELKELIGEGRFGPVYRGNWHGEVAIKKIDIDENDQEQLRAFKREVQQFKKTRHDNIILFTGVCMTPPNLAIVTNLCKGQTLYVHIHVRKDRFNLIKAIQFSTQIAQNIYITMSGCLDNMNCRVPECCESLGERRNTIASVTSGIFFFVGWWVFIDAAVHDRFLLRDGSQINVTPEPVNPAKPELEMWYIVIAVVSTIAFFFVNAVSNGAISGDMYTGGCLGQTGARIWLFIGFLLSFGGLIASLWILFQIYIIDKDNAKEGIYPGVAVFLQNFFIFIASIIFKFGRTDDQWE